MLNTKIRYIDVKLGEMQPEAYPARLSELENKVAAEEVDGYELRSLLLVTQTKETMDFVAVFSLRK